MVFLTIGLFLLLVIDPFKWIASIDKEIERRSLVAAKRKAEKRQYLLDNPHVNTTDWEIHKYRMIKHEMSRFRGTYYYVGPRGGWYYINSNGRRTYC